MKKLIFLPVLLCLILISCGANDSNSNIDLRQYSAKTELVLTKNPTTTTKSLETTSEQTSKNNPKKKQTAQKANDIKKPSTTLQHKESHISSLVTPNTQNSETISQTTTQIETSTTEILEKLKDTDIAYITKSGNRYHRKDCYYLQKSCFEILVKEAKEKSYTPCKICKP